MRHINEAGLQLIKGFEQLSLRAYLCPAGIPTIGWGHTAGVRMGQQISVEMAEAFLHADLAEAEGTVERLVTVPLSDNQFSALVSFVFNLGVGAFAKSTLLKLLNAGRFEMVAEHRDAGQLGSIYFGQLLRFVWMGSAGVRVKSKGLIRRRVAEAELWCRG